MLMNWKTINTCFISREWQNLSGGMYAGSVIGVFVLVIAIEAVRRMKREYDRKLLRDKAEVSLGESPSQPLPLMTVRQCFAVVATASRPRFPLRRSIHRGLFRVRARERHPLT